MNRRTATRLGAVLVSALLPALMATAQPAPVRVVTWNLLPRDGAGIVTDKTVTETARVLKELNPDVIVLEQVPDLLGCEDILQALKPAEYQVAVFSSFRDAQTGDLSRQQVAILSKARASDPFWDSWQGEDHATTMPGGFASAVIHLENRNLLVFGVQLSDASPLDDGARESAAQQAARESATRQLVQRLDALHESSNAIPAIVVAGDFNTTPDDPKLSHELTLVRLERAGLSNAISSLPPAKRITLPGNGKRPDATVDYLFTRNAGQVVNIQAVPVSVSLHYPLTGDLTFETPAPAPAPVATPAPVSAPVVATQAPAPLAIPAPSVVAPPATNSNATTQAETPPSLAAFWQTLVGQIGIENIRWLTGLLAGGVLFTVAGFWLLARRTRVEARSTTTGVKAGMGGMAPSGAGEVMIMTPAVRTGSATDMLPVVHIQGPAQIDAQSWQRRAELAERRADQATDVVRRGLIGELARWLRGGAARRLVSDRAQLLEAQRMAAMKIQVVDERLTKVEQHIEQRTREYETRIGELEKELAEAREENRELIRAKIAQVRAEMERERAKLMQHARTNA
ncbi:MAG TPA: endonuclease/exonuclease/phosphatase family protein [Verrucomicrobiae bacterium]|nr:endonuclease/exonuclease/phosphatase family protein [Verrucomicrobiae bacterium]